MMFDPSILKSNYLMRDLASSKIQIPHANRIIILNMNNFDKNVKLFFENCFQEDIELFWINQLSITSKLLKMKYIKI